MRTIWQQEWQERLMLMVIQQVLEEAGGGSRYPLDVHPGTGGTEVAEVIEDTPSLFQQSIEGGPDLPFKDYYVGGDPTAANIAWGEDEG